VRLGDAGVAALLAPGSRVDVVGSGAGGPAVLAADAAVLTVLPPEERPAAGRLVLVALPRGIAARVASASLAEEITITLR
jgi:pilus assembly protein CpaB